METFAIGLAVTASSYATTGSDALMSLSPSTAPTGVTGVKLYSTSSSQLGFVDGSGNPTTFTTSNSAPRTFSLPDQSGALITDNASQTLTGKTLPSTSNVIDANAIVTAPVTGMYSAGDVLGYTPAGTWAPLTFSATAPITYSGGNISATVGTVANTLAAGNDPRFIESAQVLRVKSSAVGYGEYSSIASAVATIVDASGAKPYVVYVSPGTYTEPPIVVPSYVFIRGESQGSVVRASTANTTLFTLNGRSGIDGLYIIGLNGSTDIGVAASGLTVVINAIIQDFSTCVSITSPTTTSVDVTGQFIGTWSRAVDVTASASCSVRVVGSALGSATTTRVISVAGALADIRDFTAMTTASTGVGLYVGAASTVTCSGVTFTGFNRNIEIPSGGIAPVFRAVAARIAGAAGAGARSLLVSHTGAIGSFSGIANTSTVENLAPALTLSYSDPGVGSVVNGDLYFNGFGGTPTDISGQLTTASDLGSVSGGVVAAAVGLSVSVSAGVGYISAGSYPSEYVRKITWAGTTLTLDPSATHYVYANATGVLSGATTPDYRAGVLLARVRTTATGIEFIDSQLDNATHTSNRAKIASRNTAGVLFSRGGIVSDDGALHLSVTAGIYYWFCNEFSTTGGSPISWFAYYRSGLGFTRVSQNTVDRSYDTGSGLAAIPGGLYAKHSVYLVGAGPTEQYFLVYGDTTFATEQAAIAAAHVSAPSYFEQGVVRIASLVVSQTTLTVIDTRPVAAGSASTPSAGVTSHGDLTGLTADDHPHYLLVNGSRPMGGALDMAGFNILSAPIVNGVTVAAHASRHLPAGADPLTTAAAVGLSSATINAVGTANSFARSDHTHAVDVSGFNKNTLAGTLAVAGGGTGLTTLTPGQVLVGGGASLDLTKPAPVGVFVGTTDTQTLTGKTITDSSNTVSASLIRSVTVSAAPSSIDQVLKASGPSNASWTLISDSSLTGQISVQHGGTGLATLTSGRVLVGGGTSLDLTKLAPAGVFVGTTDTQTLTGKTIRDATNDVSANAIRAVDVLATPASISQVLVAASPTTASWSLIGDSSLTGQVSVQHGGTGLATLTSGRVLIGGGTSLDLTKLAPTGAFVGTTDTQTLTGKTISGLTNTITGIDHTVMSNIGTNTHTQIDAHIAATTAHGITGAIVGTTDSQTLTNKTLNNPVLSSAAINSPTIIGGHVYSAGLHFGGLQPCVLYGSNDLVLTLPAGPDALVGVAAAQILASKTLSSPTITAITDNTGISPATLILRDPGKYMTIGSIQSSMLGDSSNIVRPGSSPTFAAVTVIGAAAVGSLTTAGVVTAGSVTSGIVTANTVNVAGSFSALNATVTSTLSAATLTCTNATFSAGVSVGSLLTSGSISAGSINGGGIVGTTGTYSGTITGTNATFSGVLTAATHSGDFVGGTVSGTSITGGTIAGTTGTFSGAVTAASFNGIVNFASTDTVQTFTNKTLTSAALNTSLVLNGGSGYTIDWTPSVAARAYTIRDVGGNASFAMTDGLYTALVQGVAPTVSYSLRAWRGRAVCNASGVATFFPTTTGTAGGTPLYTLANVTYSATARLNTSTVTNVPWASIKTDSSNTTVTVNVIDGTGVLLGGNTVEFSNGVTVDLVITAW